MELLYIKYHHHLNISLISWLPSAVGKVSFCEHKKECHGVYKCVTIDCNIKKSGYMFLPHLHQIPQLQYHRCHHNEYIERIDLTTHNKISSFWIKQIPFIQYLHRNNNVALPSLWYLKDAYSIHIRLWILLLGHMLLLINLDHHLRCQVVRIPLTFRWRSMILWSRVLVLDSICALGDDAYRL